MNFGIGRPRDTVYYYQKTDRYLLVSYFHDGEVLEQKFISSQQADDEINKYDAHFMVEEKK